MRNLKDTNIKKRQGNSPNTTATASIRPSAITLRKPRTRILIRQEMQHTRHQLLPADMKKKKNSCNTTTKKAPTKD